MSEFDALETYSQSGQCIICDVQLIGKPIRDANRDIWTALCTNCGKYRITDSAFEEMKGRRNFHSEYLPLLSHTVRRGERHDNPALINVALLERVFGGDLELPDAFEQIENMIIWLAENLRHPGDQVHLSHQTFQAIVGAADATGFEWVLRSAYENGWVAGLESSGLGETFSLLNASLTLSGWQWYRDIGRHKRSRMAFMAMKYGDPVLEPIVNDHFAPAVELAGFKLRRLDDDPEAGLIDNRLRVEIRRSRLLIADLTHDNRGAYWEAGFAEGLDLPVIYTCEAMKLNEGVHFDTRNCLIVPWNAKKPELAADELKATIRNTLPDEAILDDPEQAL